MLRPIVDYKLDERIAWKAILNYGNPQHVRLKPPFENRAWFTTEEGRLSLIAQLLN